MPVATLEGMTHVAGQTPRKILIVDDDDATRRGLTALLSEAGYTVLPSASLKSAMEALSKDEPDLLITDVRLQGYNGLQLVAMSPRQIPTIVVTGFPDRMLEADAHKMGAEYLLKPVSPSALLALIEQKLGADHSETAFSPSRRWTRKPVTSQLKAWFEDLPVRILDISYGGLRLEIDRTRDAELPPSLSLTLPTSNVAIDVNVVWQRKSAGNGWTCGAAIPEPSPVLWRQLVDGVPSY